MIKQCALLFLAILILSVNSVAQTRVQPTEREKGELLQQLMKDDADVRSGVNDFEGRMNGAVASMGVKKTDLNRDRQAEYIIQYVLGTMLCSATGNCPQWVYFKTGSRYRLLLKVTGNDISIEKSSTNGYRDLSTSGHYSASEIYVIIYKFNGDKYQAKDCSIRSRVGKRIKIVPQTCRE